MKLILASASEARARMLRDVGLAIDVEPASVDEAALRDHMAADGAAVSDIAAILAQVKAKVVSAAHPDDLVIGADQLLVLGHEIFEKPKDQSAARETLQRLRGRTHELVSAAVLVRGGEPLWRASDEARLTMRNFSDAFLEDYLAQEGDEALSTVGAYRLEGPGAQLFSRIEGDYFTILGLPLMALLGVLREAEILPT